jgi:hypothetical protein
VVLVLTSASLTLLGAVQGVGAVEIGNNSFGGNPASGLPGLDVEDVHGVDLLKGPALGLVDEEEDNEDSEEAASSEDVTVAEVDGVGDEGGEERDEEVPGPVGSSSNTHADSAVLEGVHLTTDSPDNRTPGGGESDNEEAGEHNHNNTSGVVGRVGVQDLVADRGPDQEADEHPSGTVHQTLAATVVLDNVKTGKGHTEVDSTEDDGGDVGVAQSNTLEDTGSVVEDEVGTSQLLEGLEGNSEDDTVEHAGTSEDLLPGSVTVGELLLKLDLHVGHLLSNDAVVVGDTVELAHNIASLLGTAVTVGETGGLGKEEGTNTEDKRPGKSNAHGDAPRSIVFESLSAEVDNVGDEDTESDEQLESTDHGTADLARGRLRLVHGDDARERTNTQTSDPTAQGNLVPLVSGSNLDNNTDDVEKGPEGDREFAANAVRDGGGNQGTNHSSDRELDL